MLLRGKDKQFLIQLFSTIDKPLELIAYGNRVNNTAYEARLLSSVTKLYCQNLF